MPLSSSVGCILNMSDKSSTAVRRGSRRARRSEISLVVSPEISEDSAGVQLCVSQPTYPLPKASVICLRSKTVLSCKSPSLHAGMI